MTTFKEPTPKEQILTLRGLEFPTTLRVLKAFPEDRLDMRPAEKSRTARELIHTFIGEQYVCRGALLGDDPYRDVPRTFPERPSDLLEMFNRIHDEVQDMIVRADPAELNRIVQFNGWSVRVLEVLWVELLDQIHHRGQFSVYLRLVGAKVPSIYGPTADDAGRR